MALFRLGLLLFAILANKICFSHVLITEDEKRLVGVAVLFRHGDRAPLKSFPTDPYANEKYWPGGMGQLLKSGEKRQYDLGMYLRKRYKNFLSQDYSSREIYVLSSDVDRAIMSAGANLAGLYRPMDYQMFEEGLNWIPIPVHTLPHIQDGIIGIIYKPCPIFYKLFLEVMAHQTTALMRQYPGFFEVISNKTGWSKDQIDFYKLYDTLYTYQQQNLTSFIPPWYEAIDKDLLEYLAGLEGARSSATLRMKRLYAGQFFYYLLDRFDAMFNGTAAKFLMMSGHDIVTMVVLDAMGAYDNHPPDYTATIIWELYVHQDGKRSINVLYKRNVTGELRQLSVLGCYHSCNYEVFKRLMSPIAVDETTWQNECRLESDARSVNLSGLSLFVMFVILICVYTIF